PPPTPRTRAGAGPSGRRTGPRSRRAGTPFGYLSAWSKPGVRPGRTAPFSEPPPHPLEGLPSNQRLDAKRLALLREEVKGLEEVVALALALKDCPTGRIPLLVPPGKPARADFDPENCRLAAYLLRLDALRVQEAGRPGEAPDRIHATLHAGA